MGSKCVVIGGGHNGLSAAIILAKAGRQVTVFEASKHFGGVAAGAEFHPGYRHQGILHDTHVMAEALKRLGLNLPTSQRAPTAGQRPDGSLVMWEGWTAPMAKAVADLAGPALAEAPPAIGADAKFWPLAKNAIAFRRLGAHTMMELLRLGPQSLRDFCAEFEPDEQKRAMWMMPALLGSWCGPWSPEMTANLLIDDVMGAQSINGGPAAVVEALLATAKSLGVTLQNNSRVTGIRLNSNGVRGVVLADGTEVEAPWILSAIGPRQTLLELVPTPWLAPVVERDIEDVRVRGIDAKLHFALSSPVEIAGKAHERMVLAMNETEIERAFDGVKYGEVSQTPLPLDIRQLTVADPSLAPDGHAVLSVFVHGVPLDLRKGWSAQTRDALVQAALASMARWWPDIRDKVVAHELLTPVDLASRFGLEGGHLFHGERFLDQMFVMRPTPQLAQYAVPQLRGLYLGSSGCHPGGTVSCLPGILGASALLAG